MKPPIKICVIDDHPLFRDGVIHSMSEMDDFLVVGQGSTKDDAVRIVEEAAPDVTLMDISMPGGGLQALAAIRQTHPSHKVVMLTVSEEPDDVALALNTGAVGYILKGIGSRMLAEVLRAIAAGEIFVTPTLSAKLMSQAQLPLSSGRSSGRLSTLTPREQEVLELVGAGLSNKHVALKLGLHEKTVKHHMSRILAKLNVSNRTEAAVALHNPV